MGEVSASNKVNVYSRLSHFIVAVMSQAPYWLGHCRWLLSLNALSWYFFLFLFHLSLYFTSLLQWWISSRGEGRNQEKVEYFSLPSVSLLRFDLCQSLCLFELRLCFACCLLYYNSGLHLSPESPDSWKIMFILRARKERFSQKKGNPDNQHCREQSLSP